MARHNLKTVISFEFFRTVKKKRFWIATLATLYGGTKSTDGARALADVKAGILDAYFVFPADPTTQPVRVYGVDKGIFENGTYDAVARQILVTAAQQKIGSPQLTALTQGRVTEMILTTLNPTTLIVGKIISLFIVGLMQMLVFVLPVFIGYVFFRSNLNLPDLDLSHLTFEPVPLIVGALLLLGGYTLFTGTLVAIGAIMPTAREAGTFFGSLMALIFVPFYIVSLIVSDPHALIVQIFTYFPFSAPVTAMLRNAFGSLSSIESAIVIAELFLLGVVALRLAVHLFRYGSIEYSRKLSITKSFGRRSVPR